MKSLFAANAVAALFTVTAFAQPRVARVQNNYSYILPGMPNYGIAQGSIFDIFGSGLATTTSPLQNVPLPTQLSGTSVNITVNGVITRGILYFVSPTQIAAILPSATSPGTGQITVTVNGQTSAPGAITVVPSAFGLLTLNGVGNGPAAVFDVNANYLGLTNAAHPGDFITLWGSGAGPAPGDETIAQTPRNLAGFPIEVDIGGIAATVQYIGRSIYPGLDQINVIVPPGLSGCHVSVAVRFGDTVSNFGTIPVAASGRTCSEPAIGMTASQLQTLLSRPGVTRGIIGFTGSEADVTFAHFTNAQYAAKQPFAGVSFGDCSVLNFTNFNMAVPNPIKPVFLDAGPSIRLTTPSDLGIGNLSLPFEDGGYSISNLMPTGSFKGTYTFTGSGGPDIGPFSAQVTWPGGGGGFNFSTSNNTTSVTRSQGLTVTWPQPGNTDPDEIIQISGFSYAPNMPFGAEFFCNVPLEAGRFTIPPTVLLALPPQPAGSMPQAVLEVDLTINKSFTAPGVDVGTISFFFTNIEEFSYQ